MNFAKFYGDSFRQVEEPLAGKYRAQIGRGSRRVLAFVDDDVTVTSNWAVTARHFRASKDDAMQGPVLFPPELKQNEAFLRAHHKFKSINFVRYSRKLKHLKTLTDANMAIRKEVFSRIGYFTSQRADLSLSGEACRSDETAENQSHLMKPSSGASLCERR
jgi:hypothetical protein